ncbi:MAG: regulatory protein RecX [Bacteroidia bacterium]
MRYCAYQERCRQEVKQKMRNLDVMDDDQEDMLLYLEEEGFLDEKRFARVFAGGKFRVKRWGKRKIFVALRKKAIPESYISKAFASEIPDKDYLSAVDYLAERYIEQHKHLSAFERKKKVYQFLSQKGYEADIIWQVLDPDD